MIHLKPCSYYNAVGHTKGHYGDHIKVVSNKCVRYQNHFYLLNVRSPLIALIHLRY